MKDLTDNEVIAQKRKEMSKETWIKNVMRIHPEKTREETKALHQKLFEAKTPDSQKV